MDALDRVMGIMAGIISIFGGICIVSKVLPTITIWSGFSAPTARWVGWVSIFFGLAFVIANIHGLLTDRKKHRAAIERCKIERQREAEAAKGEETE